MQTAHGLKWPQALEAGGKHNEKRDCDLEDAVIEKSRYQQRQSWHVGCGFFACRFYVAAQEAKENIHQDQRGKNAQPLIPLPAREKIKSAGGGGLAPGVG